jgi:hypothetical protein
MLPDMPNSDFPTKIKELMSDHDKFNALVYTPLNAALEEIKCRQSNKKLEAYVEALPMEIPNFMKDRMNAVLFRHLATPNYEIRRFIHIVSALDGQLTPIILEYKDDKFTNLNECKFYLGKICLYKGKNKLGESLFEFEKIIDINDSNCKPISSIKTFWGQSLVDFHHELFFSNFPYLKDNVFDFSTWLHNNGHSAKAYYKLFLSLFLQNNILLENFLLEGRESVFIREVILPSILEITKEAGVKPLIVALEPTDIEGDKFWHAHAYEIKEYIQKKRQNII